MSENDDDPRQVPDPEILGPVPEEPQASIIALISQYTERPDLLIAELERHDPGFVRGMNKRGADIADKTREATFRFGQFQAYTSLVLQVVAAFVLLGITASSFIRGDASFWTVIALIVFYAVSQSGVTGFVELTRGLARALRNRGKD